MAIKQNVPSGSILQKQSGHYTRSTECKKCNFTWQLEKFSHHDSRRDTVSSPAFQCQPGGRPSLGLVLDFQNADNIDIYLTKLSNSHTTANEDQQEQFLNVSISVLGRFGQAGNTLERKIAFDGNSHSMQLCSISRSEINRFCGLNRMRLLPNDCLTIKCDVIVAENDFATDHCKLTDVEFEKRLRDDFSTTYLRLKCILVPATFLCFVVAAMASAGSSRDATVIVTGLLSSGICFKLKPLMKAIMFYEALSLKGTFLFFSDVMSMYKNCYSLHLQDKGFFATTGFF